MPAGPQAFAPRACERLEPFLESQVVGQGLALRQLCDAVCDHINNPNPIKPLVLSVHGPPGVGKSMVHQLAARALYNAEPAADMQCPGLDCPGYKVHPHASSSTCQAHLYAAMHMRCPLQLHAAHACPWGLQPCPLQRDSLLEYFCCLFAQRQMVAEQTAACRCCMGWTTSGVKGLSSTRC